MKPIYFLIMIIISFQGLNAQTKEICDIKCQGNKVTQDLNKKKFAPTAAITSPAASSSASQNHLKVLGLLHKLLNVLKPKEDADLPDFAPNRVLRPSDKDDSIPALRQILQSLGYLDKASDSPFFDMELEKAIKAFQAGHCLEPDGIIGDATKDRLTWGYNKRITMIKDSIKKLKNLVFTDLTLIVNIPTYTMYAYEDQNLKMRMKVIVGQPKRRTPLMTSYIDAVELFPEWVIPPTILLEDKLPKIQEDPNFFQANNIEVFDQNNDQVDTSQIDWHEVDTIDFPYVFKQMPGKQNALGLIKFNLQNNDLIYMHDTSLPELFKKYSRALSSGCIRVENAIKLASWVFGANIEDVKAELDAGTTETKQLEKLIAVHITYLPVWVEENGKVLWGDDPYGLEPSPFY